MKAHFTFRNDYLITLIRARAEIKPSQPNFFSLSELNKPQKLHLDNVYNSFFLSSKDPPKLPPDSCYHQYQLKHPFGEKEESTKEIGVLLTEVFSIKLLNCSLLVCLEFVKKFFEGQDRVPGLRKLKFVGCEIDDRFMEVFLQRESVLKRLQYLSFKGCTRLTDLSLRAFLASPNLEDLKDLDLSFMNLDEDALCVLAYSDLVKRLRKLKLLELKAKNFTKGLRELLTPDQMPKLESIHFSEDSQDDDTKSFNRYGFQYVSLQLKRLHFRSGNGTPEIITFHDVKNYHYANLQILQLRGCQLTTDFFQSLEIARFLINIKEFDFSSCTYKNDTLNSLEKLLLSSRLTSLQSLNLSNSNIKDSTLTLISETKYLGNLESLFLDHCPEISSEGVNRVLFSNKRTKKLRILTLHHTKISDDVIYNLVYRFDVASTEQKRILDLELKCLDLTNCDKLQAQCLSYLAESKQIKSIGVLKLGNTNMNDYALEILSNKEYINLLMISKLDLSCCANLTSQGLVDFFKNFKGTRLRHLKLRRTAIDDQGVKELCNAAFIENLEKLKLNGCKKITDNGVDMLIKSGKFKKLRVLSLLGVAVSDNNIQNLGTSSLIANLRTLNLMKCRQITNLFELFQKSKSGSFSSNFDWDHFLTQFSHLVDDKCLEQLSVDKERILGIRKLCFSGFSKVTSQGLKNSLSKNQWPLLESIVLSNSHVDGKVLKDLFHLMTKNTIHNLRILDFSNNPLIEENHIIEIFKVGNVSKNFYVDEFLFKGLLLNNRILENFSFVKNMVVIDLSRQNLLGSSDAHDKQSDSFQRVFGSLGRASVQKLVLDYTNVSDADLLNLNPAENLKVISLLNCPKITTNALINLAKNKGFSKDFDLRCLLKLDQLINDDFIKALPDSNYLENLKLLDLNANGLVSSAGFQILATSDKVRRIQKIDLSQTNIDDEALNFIANGQFEGLERIDVSDCPLVTSQGLMSLISGRKFSNKFNLDFLLQGSDVRRKLDEQAIESIIGSQYRKSFRKMNFKSLLKAFSLEIFQKLIATCENLQEIDIRKTDFDVGLLEMLAESPSRSTLRTLQMEDSIGLNEFNEVHQFVMDKIKTMSEEIDVLKQVSLQKNGGSTEEEKEKYGGFKSDHFLQKFHIDSRNVETKYIGEIKNELKLAQFKLLDKSCFEVFDFEYYLFSEKASVNDLALQFLGSKLFEVLKNKFPARIQEMNIPDAETMTATLRHVAFIGNLNITHRGLGDLVSSPNIANLEILDLSNTKVNDQAIEAIGKSLHLKQLKNLFFMDSPYITAKSLDYLIHAEKNLPNLNLQPILRVFSHWIDDSVIEVLAESPLLRNISILYLNKSQITDNAFEFLSKSNYAERIKCLDISDAFMVSDKALEILAGCIVFKKKLYEINMLRTPLISAKGLITLLASENFSPRLDLYKIVFKQKLELLTVELLLAYTNSRYWNPRLRKLMLSNAVLLAAQDFISFFQLVQKKTPRFFEIHIENTNINDGVLKELAKLPFFEHVRLLNIKGCPYVSHLGVAEFFKEPSKCLDKLQIAFDSSIVRIDLIECFTQVPSFLSNIQKLDFSNNLYFDNECLRKLISCPEISNLRLLDLSSTNVDASGVIFLTNCLNLKNLCTLGLKNLSLTSESLKLLSDCKLFSVYFQITEVYKNLEEQDRRLVTDDVLITLFKNEKLLRQIVHLDLSYTDVSSQGISSLAVNPNTFNLETLDISCTEVDDIGMIAIANAHYLTGLKKIVFQNCSRITKVSIKFLAGKTQGLNFSWQDVIETGVLNIPASPLRASISIEPIKWVLFDFPSLKALAQNRTCQRLGQEGRLKLPVSFQIKNKEHFKEILMNGLIFRNLREIYIENNAYIHEKDLVPITECAYLRNLRKVTILRCANITSKTLESFVKAYRVLISLEISHLLNGNEKIITDSVLSALETSPYLSKIESLSLECNHQVTVEGFKHIAKSRFCFNIYEINCSNSDINDEGLKELANSKFLLNLRRIILKGCSQITAQGLKYIITSNCLSYHFSIDDLFANLAEIHQKNILSDELLDCLSSSSRLKYVHRLRLFYDKNEVTPIAFKKLLSNNNIVNLHAIDFSSSVISSQMLEAISQNFNQLRSLRQINLEKTTGYTAESVSNLVIALTPEVEWEKEKENKDDRDKKGQGIVNYKLQKKGQSSFKIIPKKFDLQHLVDRIKIEQKIFNNLLYCPFFYNVRHFTYTDKTINQFILKDLVLFQQSRNIRRIDIQADNIDANTASIFSKSEVLRDLEQLELPRFDIDALIELIGTKIVHREYEPFSLFKNTISKITNAVLLKIAKWEKLLNTTKVNLSGNKLITSKGILDLLSTSYSCQLTEIDLSGTNVDNSAVSTICNNPRLPRLQILKLENCKELNSESLKLICDDKQNNLSPFFDYNTPFKDLQRNIDDSVLHKLKESRIVQYLTKLDFSNLGVSPEILLELLSREELCHLQDLRLINTKVDDGFLEKLSQLRHLSCLKVLKLVDPDSAIENKKIANGIKFLFKANFSDYFDITDFIVQIKNFIDNDICEAMKDSKLLRNLYLLDLRHAKFSAAKILEILKNPHLRHLQELDLSFTGLDNDTFGKLSSTPGFKNVVLLSVEGCHLDDSNCLIDFFNGKNLNQSFNFQALFDEIVEKFDRNFVSFGAYVNIPLFGSKVEDNSKCLMSVDFFNNFMKTEFYIKRLAFFSLASNFRFLDSVALLPFENKSDSFDISQYLFSLPLRIKQRITDSDIQLIVQNFSHIKYIQLKKLSNVSFGVNFLLKADTTTKFELAFKAQYLKKSTVQASVSADSLQKFLNDTSLCTEFFSFIRDLDFSKNNFLSYFNAIKDRNTEHNWKQVNAEVFAEIKEELDRWREFRTSNSKGNKVAAGSEIPSPDSRSPTHLMNHMRASMMDLKKMQVGGQKINLIDDHIQTKVILPFIMKCTHLKTLILKNQNIGDLFLKEFSMFLSIASNLKNLRVLNFEGNTRITAVGLKYLYTSVYKRAGKLKIFLEAEKRDLTLMSPHDGRSSMVPIEPNKPIGVQELGDNLFKEPFLKNLLKIEEIKDLESGPGSPVSKKSVRDLRDTQGKSTKNLGTGSPGRKTKEISLFTSAATKKEKIGVFEEYQILVTTLMIYGVFETINLHFINIWKRHYLTVTLLVVVFFPFTLFHLYRLMMKRLGIKLDALLNDKRLKNLKFVKWLNNCIRSLSNSLKCKCMLRKVKAPEKQEVLKIEGANLFYFDKDVAFLNSVLSFKTLGKNEESTFKYRPFFLRYETIFKFCLWGNWSILLILFRRYFFYIIWFFFFFFILNEFLLS